MPRREKAVGLIQCRTDAETINAIAESRGLTAEPADVPNQFYLLYSGRNMASELEPELFDAVTGALDAAVRQGVIPAWSMLESSV
jgi:hypothetical protein